LKHKNAQKFVYHTLEVQAESLIT